MTGIAIACAFFGGGTAACYFAVRAWCGDLILAWIVTAAFGARAALALLLYIVSYAHLPLLNNLQMGQGFWSFAPDCLYFHQYASDAAVALKAGLDLPFVSGSPDYPLLLAALYRIVGPQPLLMVWLNVASSALTVVLIFDLSRKLWSAREAYFAAGLAAFWPSSLLWSTQLLKDPLEILFVIAFFWSVHELSGFDTVANAQRRRTVVPWIVGFLSLFAAVRLRSYVGVLLLVAGVVSLLVPMATNGRTSGPRMSAAWGAALWLTCALVIALAIPAEFAAKPLDPVAPLQRLAEYMAVTGDTAGAQRQVREAFAWRLGPPADSAERDRQVDAQVSRLMSRSGGAGWPRRAQTSEQAPVSEDGSPDAGISSSAWSRLFRLFDPSVLASTRRTFFEHGGWTLGQSEAMPRNALGIVAQAPAALLTTLFTPNPWTLLAEHQTTPLFRYGAFLELPLVCTVLVFGARGLYSTWRRRVRVGLAVALFALMLMTGLGFLVPNVGALFRLRAAALISLCVLACGGVPNGLGWLRRSTAGDRTIVSA